LQVQGRIHRPAHDEHTPRSWSTRAPRPGRSRRAPAAPSTSRLDRLEGADAAV